MDRELRAEAERIRKIDHEINLHSTRLPKRPIDLEQITRESDASLAFVAESQFGIRPPKLRDLAGIYVSDGLVPPCLHREPCYPWGNPHTETYSTIICTEDISIPHESIYAWIPSIFTVSEGGNDVSIDSYINGLGPRNQFPTLYRLLEKVFLFILHILKGHSRPSWSLQNELGDDTKGHREGLSRDVAFGRNGELWPYTLDNEPLLTFYSQPHERIVASAIYYYDNNEWICDQGLGFRRVRRPEEDFPIFMEHNADVKTIHILERQDFYVRQLFPKKEEDLDSQPEVNYDAPVIRDYPSDSDYDRSHVSLGTITTTYSESSPPTTGHGTGRIVSFPNWIQLCFFLVDDAEAEDGRMDFPGVSYLNLPDAPVLSTADVPWQARPTNMPTLRVLLPKACKQVIGKTLPPELVELIVGEDVYGMSREQAEMHRRDFMADRKAKVADENDIFDGEYSLCEH
ncbi:4-coumarate CoA ligase [Salix suchowensis]|nr:4-coumarate CoA ligase [Salix suchowensis]